ncbi:unknown protein [Paenibacillus amylolyticus]|uniref:Uncharacterized protein n=1 Tax=Paenibacillus amylolyticus TaxID=1451 RepID=A0A117I2Z6_PAEAM|nr:unknown protein [Paenibacillus amylolyticus]
MYDIDKLVFSSEGVQSEYNNDDKCNEIEDSHGDQEGIPCI